MRCNNCQKTGHFARACRSRQNNKTPRKRNYIENASSEEEKSELAEVRFITQKHRILWTTTTITVSNDFYWKEKIRHQYYSPKK